jgi:hypothetical protein
MHLARLNLLLIEDPAWRGKLPLCRSMLTGVAGQKPCRPHAAGFQPADFSLGFDAKANRRTTAMLPSLLLRPAASSGRTPEG